MDTCGERKGVLLFLIQEIAEIKQLSEEMLKFVSGGFLTEKLALIKKKNHSINEALAKNVFGGGEEESQLAIIMHDIRNIISAFSGFAAMAVFTKKQEELQEALKNVCNASLSVSQAIEERISLIDSVCAEQGVFQNLLQVALKLSQASWDREGKVSVFLDVPSEPIVISACGAHCIRVLMNLFNNAFDAIVAKKYPKKDQAIWVFAHVDNGILMIRIRDNGIGMDESTMEHLFQEHFTAKGKSSNGNGLHFCKEVVEKRFGGSLLAESFPGCGTTFHIKIPLHKLAA